MAIFKKRRNREIVWGQDNKIREDHEIPKPEIVLGPAGDPSMNTNTVNENAMGFLGTMAAMGASPPSSESGSTDSQESERKSSPYGWEPSSESSSSSASYSSGSYGSSDTDNLDKIMRLQRKIDNLVERIEILERKLNSD